MVWVQTVPANAHVLAVCSPMPRMLGKRHPQSAGTLQVKVKDELGHSPVVTQWQDRMRSWNGAQPSSPEKTWQHQLTRDAYFRKAGGRGSTA